MGVRCGWTGGLVVLYCGCVGCVVVCVVERRAVGKEGAGAERTKIGSNEVDEEAQVQERERQCGQHSVQRRARESRGNVAARWH